MSTNPVRIGTRLSFKRFCLLMVPNIIAYRPAVNGRFPPIADARPYARLRAMKLPAWFWLLMVVWLFLGLPVLILGGFLIPDLPPYFASYEDRSVEANATWAVAIMTTYFPIFLLPVLAVWWFRKRRNRRDG